MIPPFTLREFEKWYRDAGEMGIFWAKPITDLQMRAEEGDS